MFGLQPTHLVIIFVVALLIFGPERLPEIGRALGKTIGEFRSSTLEATKEVRREAETPAIEKKEPPPQ